MRTLPSRVGKPVLSVRARVTPVASVLLASLVPLLVPVVADWPLLPPLGLLFLLGWRLLRPGFFLPWAPLPLGAFDDLASGQPIGSAMLLWTVAFLAIDASERALLWRDYLQDWLVAAAAIGFCLFGGYLLALFAGGSAPLWSVVPQLVASILVFPVVARICARLDIWRLK